MKILGYRKIISDKHEHIVLTDNILYTKNMNITYLDLKRHVKTIQNRDIKTWTLSQIKNPITDLGIFHETTIEELGYLIRGLNEIQEQSTLNIFMDALMKYDVSYYKRHNINLLKDHKAIITFEK